MSTILETIVPEYPYSDKDEPSHLFCCNFLLHRKYQNLREYCGVSEDQTPIEKLVETLHALHLHRLPTGTPIMPGDLILIFKGSRNHMDIRHSMIAIAQDIWFGTSNYFFFSRIFKNLPEDIFMARDGISTLRLGVDFRNYSFGQFMFDVWREVQPCQTDACKE